MTDACPICLVPVVNECAGGIIDGLCYSAARRTNEFATDQSDGPNGCGAVYAQCEAEAFGGRVGTREEYDAWHDAGLSGPTSWGVTSTFNEEGHNWLHGWSESYGYYAIGSGEFAGQAGNCDHSSRYFLCVKPYYPLGSTSCEPYVGDSMHCHPDNLLQFGDQCEW